MATPLPFYSRRAGFGDIVTGYTGRDTTSQAMTSGRRPNNAFGVPAAPAGKAATTLPAPEIGQANKVIGSATGGDIAYTGGDVNALQDQNTMRRMRNAASTRLLGGSGGTLGLGLGMIG